MSEYHGRAYRQSVTFVRGKSSDGESSSWIAEPRNVPKAPVVDGNEVRDFYETVISETPSTSEPLCQQHKSKAKVKSKKSTSIKSSPSIVRRLDRLNMQYLKYAQEGDLPALSRCLKDGADINYIDGFGWTALMCSAHAGHLHIVKCLVEKGINQYAMNCAGETALSIAQSTKHERVINYLKRIESGSCREQNQSQPTKPTTNRFFCVSCQQEFLETTREAHNTSTVHLLNTKRDMPSTLYHIPESNVGYKLMVKSGWDKEQGLGPAGEGKKYPVKTVLKRNRAGLGTGTECRPKVTHFGAHDKRAVEQQKVEAGRVETRRSLNKKQRKAALSKKAKWERNFRTKTVSEMDSDMQQVLSHLGQIEGAAEDVLADKHQIVDLDRKRNKTREALRSLQKDSTNKKAWVCFGNMFLKIDKDKTKGLLEKDQKQLDEEINSLRTGLKTKVDKLRDLQNQDKIKGFHLQPLSADELKAVETT